VPATSVRFPDFLAQEEDMKATRLFRITSILLILFAIGHTVGFLKFVPPSSEGQAALAAMNTAHLDISGPIYTYGMFFRGFGISISAYLFFCAYLAWYLGNVARTTPSSITSLAFAFAALQLANLVIAVVDFPAVPIAFSAVVFLCAGAAALAARSSMPTSAPVVARP
jgi:hypothetical protein